MKDVITRQTVVDKLAAYLHHELSLSSLVAWAETSLMDGKFDDNHFSVIRDVVARVGVADVRAFGLTLRQAQDRRSVIRHLRLRQQWPENFRQVNSLR